MVEKKLSDLPNGAISIEDIKRVRISDGSWNFSDFYSRPKDDECSHSKKRDNQLLKSLNTIISANNHQNKINNDDESSPSFDDKVKIGDLEFSLNQYPLDIQIISSRTYRKNNTSINNRNIPPILRDSYQLLKIIRTEYIHENKFSYNRFEKINYLQNCYLQVYVPGSFRTVEMNHLVLDQFIVQRSGMLYTFKTILFLHDNKSYSQLQLLTNDDQSDGDKVVKVDIFYPNQDKIKHRSVYKKNV